MTKQYQPYTKLPTKLRELFIKYHDQLKAILINYDLDLSKTLPTKEFNPQPKENKKVYQATKANPIPHELLVN